MQGLSDVHVLAQEFIDAFDCNISHKHVEHVRKMKEVFRVVDALAEEDIGCDIIDSLSDQEQGIHKYLCNDAEDDDA